uniref:nucleolar protein 9 isoform X2 n=1 Tax=Myxine glutinosa TaxID=7769 RepID=UPI00358DEEB9
MAARAKERTSAKRRTDSSGQKAEWPHTQQAANRTAGRATNVEYLQRACEALREGFSSKEQEELFFCNVLKEVEGSEIPLSRDPVASRVLEQFLRVGPASCIEALIGPLCRAAPTILCHCCVARVLETGLQQLPRLLRSETDLHQNLVELVVDLVNTVTPVISEFARDMYGSFVLRILLQLLSQFFVGTAVAYNYNRDAEKKTINKQEDHWDVEDFPLPERFPVLLKLMVEQGVYPNILIFVEEEAASHVLQTALLVLHARNASLCSALCGVLCNALGAGKQESSALLERFKDRTSSHVIERLIEVADNKQLKNLYNHHMQGNVPALALHPVANYTIQRFIGKCLAKQFCKLFKELVPWLESVLAQGHMGIVTSLAEAAVRLQKKQDKLLEALLKIFHCDVEARQSCALQLFASMFTYEIYFGLGEGNEDLPSEKQQMLHESAGHSVTYHGSMLLQNLMRFQDPALIVNGLLSLKPSPLLSLSCSQFGSRVVDVFFKSPTVSSQFHEEFFAILKDRLFSMACTRYGSRVIDGIWTSLSLPQKEAVAQELGT